MLIIDELRGLKQKFINNSSLKEQAFYQFLVNDPLSYPSKNDLTDIEQICYSVFCIDIPSKKDLTNLIEVQRRTQPISGMHYTENLIELSAMVMDNVELEQKNLKSYCEKCSMRDFYILSNLFPDISSNLPQPQGAIDQIASHLHTGDFPQEDWKPLLLKALYETSDLIDIYITEQCYKRAMDDNPIVHRTNDLTYVRDTLAQVIKKTERRVKFAMGMVSALLLLLISCWLVPLIIRNWDKAEPIMAVIELLGSLIFILIIIFLGFMPDRIKFLNSLREKVIDWVFKRKGFNRLEVKETLDRLANQSEK